MRAPQQAVIVRGSSALELLQEYVGASGYLWIANYDGTSRMNPNWLADVDDFGAAWAKTAGITVATGQADPSGGTAAVKLTDSGATSVEAAHQNIVTVSPTERWFIRAAFKAGGSGADDKKVSLGIYNQTAGGGFPAQTMSIVSGPGTVVSASPDRLTDMSETAWTVVEVSLDAVAVTGNNYRAYIYPGTNVVPAASSVYVFRPTVEAAGHDGILWSTGATAPQPPAKWDDMIQGLSAVPTSAPYLRWNGTTNAFEMAFDGTDDRFETATFSAVAQPNTIFALAQSADITAGRRVIDGAVAGSQNAIGHSATNFFVFAGSSVTGSAVDTDLHVYRGNVNGASSSIGIDGVLATSGDAGAQTITGFALGSNHTAGDFWQGGISAVAFFPSSLTATQAAYIEGLINQLHNNAVTLP